MWSLPRKRFFLFIPFPALAGQGYFSPGDWRGASGQRKPDPGGSQRSAPSVCRAPDPAGQEDSSVLPTAVLARGVSFPVTSVPLVLKTTPHVVCSEAQAPSSLAASLLVPRDVWELGSDTHTRPVCGSGHTGLDWRPALLLYRLEKRAQRGWVAAGALSLGTVSPIGVPTL